MNTSRHHADWLSLVEVSGPFVSLPVLLRVFPQGLDARDPAQAKALRDAYDEWQKSPTAPGRQRAWILHVLTNLLGYPADLIAEGQTLPAGLEANVAQMGETLRPDFALVGPKNTETAGQAHLLISTYPLSQSLDRPVAERHWKANPATRMMELLHASGVPLGLVTNGEHWMLVHAPRGETTGYASWYGALWLDEPITLRAFHSLLGVHRFFGVDAANTLLGLLKESAQDQQEVTDQLGYQVREAVQVLVQAFDTLDQDSNRTLLKGIAETDLYDAALTVMMRLVFLFSAEERGLLHLGTPLYDDNYAVSTLMEQLQEVADHYGPQVLERRYDAWARLLATFRAVHGGVNHQDLIMPAYGGSLFDPDRYPFLEGRAAGTKWTNTPAELLGINNRVVLHLLSSLQRLRMKVPGGGPSESRRLSFRALGVEQIGHVYEGLLDHTAVRAIEPVLGMKGTRDKETEIPLAKLEAILAKGQAALVEFLHDETGRSEKAITRALDEGALNEEHQLLIACGHDASLLQRVRTFAGLIREDSFERPVVVLPGGIYVTAGTTRRSTGTHYTPPSLTEPIVQYTLEPLVYRGPAEGLPQEQWQLKSPKEVLDLKVCDMAMGSGAFLVQACRYLSERLTEAWENEEKQHPNEFLVTPEGGFSQGSPSERLIPQDAAERLAIARRIVADRCLYGVDINPMAVEMAKLSMWLITLDAKRPFTFLDHAFKCGDSLLGLSSFKQLEDFSLRPGGVKQAAFSTMNLRRHVEEAKRKRELLEAMPSDTPEQVASKAALYTESEEAVAKLKAAADILVAVELKGFKGSAYETELEAAADRMMYYWAKGLAELRSHARDCGGGQRIFHWPLSFPETMERGGFDAIVGNPPFLGGVRISELHGDAYNEFLAITNPPYSKRVDLCAYFFRRGAALTNESSCIGLLATNTISQGTTRRGGLDAITEGGVEIIYALKSFPWPGYAAVVAALVILRRGVWRGQHFADGQPCAGINTLLDPISTQSTMPERLRSNSTRSFQGSGIWGEGFFISEDIAHRFLNDDPRNAEVVKPAIGGEELNNSLEIQPNRWIIDMGERDYEDAQSFSGPFQYLYDEIRPWRQTKDPKKYARIVQSWWKYFHSRSDLYNGVRQFRLTRVLARARVSDRHMVAFLPTGIVYTEQLAVFLLDRWWHFAVIQSGLHDVWARTYASTLKTDVRYVPPDCFYTFPFPGTFDSAQNRLDEIGRKYYEFRSSLMRSLGLGLTSTYNRFHDPDEKTADIKQLRLLHEEMDCAVATAYGWGSLEFGHGFHKTKQGPRYTICEAARRQVLSLLLALNHQRHAEEKAEEMILGKQSKATTKLGRKAKPEDAQGGAILFSEIGDQG
jgi:hypothetical protein